MIKRVSCLIAGLSVRNEHRYQASPTQSKQSSIVFGVCLKKIALVRPSTLGSVETSRSRVTIVKIVVDMRPDSTGGRGVQRVEGKSPSLAKVNDTKNLSFFQCHYRGCVG